MANKQPLHPAVVEHYRKIGRKGGAARAKKLTSRRRKEIASSGARARWKKRDERLKMDEDRWPTWEEGD